MHLTKKIIEAFQYNGSAKHIEWSDKITGLGVRFYPSGKKAYVFDYRHNKRKFLMVIGHFPSMSLDTAEAKAKAFQVDVDNGINPLEEQRRTKNGKLVKDLCKAYLEGHAIHKKSGYADIAKINRFILPAWGNLPILDIKRADVKALHAKAGEHGPYQANRLYSLISKMFSFARAEELVPEDHINPCFGITKFKEEKRERFVSHEEFPRLAEAINAELNQSVVYAVWLYLLTGVRKNELLTLKWADIDFTRKELKLSDTKNGKAHYLPLSSSALEVLNQIPRLDGNPYVIVGKNQGCHLVNIDKPWQRIRKAANLEDVRLHDLRRTVGSWLAQSNNSLHLIGKVLNHSNQSTTAIYARFGNDAVRDALEQHGQQIMGGV